MPTDSNSLLRGASHLARRRRQEGEGRRQCVSTLAEEEAQTSSTAGTTLSQMEFFLFLFLYFIFFFHNQDSKSSLFITSDPTTSYRLQKQSCRLLSPPTGAWAPQSAEKDPTEGEAVVDMADELLGLLLLSLYS